jgi:predicted metal-dependent phosphoesterase TrpH
MAGLLAVMPGQHKTPQVAIETPPAPKMNPMMNADLHCHSVISDGTLTPEALAERAKANGVELWALTDHDEVAGQERAMAAAKALGLPYLTGTEISVTFAHQTVHIVGLGFDPHNTDLVAP